jgi:acyl-CoA reductase-like NAD-dependent aldehyde dehydrogenase
VAVVKDAPSPAPAAAKIEVENPATGEIIAEVPAMNAAQVKELCARARAAQPGW